MEGNTMLIVARTIVEHKRNGRKSNGAVERRSDYYTSEFDTNGVERDGCGDERCHQDSTRQSRDNV